MANWCSNWVWFSGEEENIKKVFELFQEMQRKSKQDGLGKIPPGSTSDDYIFDIDWTDYNESLHYETTWAENTEVLMEIADQFDVGFTHKFEESGNMIYGKAVYENSELSKICLDEADFSKFWENEEDNSYYFEGEVYDSDAEILETLLERKTNPLYMLKEIKEENIQTTISVFDKPSTIAAVSNSELIDIERYYPVMSGKPIGNQTAVEGIEYLDKAFDYHVVVNHLNTRNPIELYEAALTKYNLQHSVPGNILFSATAKDFRPGAVLVDASGYEFTILTKSKEGIWEARGTESDRMIFEADAENYSIKNPVLEKRDQYKLKDLTSVPGNILFPTTAKDFRPGAVLVDASGYEFTILQKYNEGTWEARGTESDRMIFEADAETYSIKNPVLSEIDENELTIEVLGDNGLEAIHEGETYWALDPDTNELLESTADHLSMQTDWLKFSSIEVGTRYIDKHTKALQDMMPNTVTMNEFEELLNNFDEYRMEDFLRENGADLHHLELAKQSYQVGGGYNLTTLKLELLDFVNTKESIIENFYSTLDKVRQNQLKR